MYSTTTTTTVTTVVITESIEIDSYSTLYADTILLTEYSMIDSPIVISNEWEYS